MECRRTGNAGVLLTLDGVRILLDGVCRRSGYYLATPLEEKDNLLACPPDITAFTHGHLDHFDRDFAQEFYHQTLRPVLGPEGLLKEGCICEPVTVGGVTVTPIVSRHIGKAGQGIAHVSYLVEGSRRILFAGDASPIDVQNQKADVLIAPYAYAITENGWKVSGQIAPKLVLLHLPVKDQDLDGLWSMVENTAQTAYPELYIPHLLENIEI